jgi:hypothetical protein
MYRPDSGRFLTAKGCDTIFTVKELRAKGVMLDLHFGETLHLRKLVACDVRMRPSEVLFPEEKHELGPRSNILTVAHLRLGEVSIHTKEELNIDVDREIAASRSEVVPPILRDVHHITLLERSSEMHNVRISWPGVEVHILSVHR